MNIGKIPTDAWRQANIAAWQQYDAVAWQFPIAVGDFNAAMRREILGANQVFFATIVNPGPGKAPRNNVPKTPAISDVSRAKLYIPGDLMIREAQVDHIVPFKHWGCNHIKNARVLSKYENTNPNVIRTAGNDIDAIALEDLDLEGLSIMNSVGKEVYAPRNCSHGNVIDIDLLKWLLVYADDMYNSSRANRTEPTHGRRNVIRNAGDLTDNDMYALKQNINFNSSGAHLRDQERHLRDQERKGKPNGTCRSELSPEGTANPGSAAPQSEMDGEAPAALSHSSRTAPRMGRSSASSSAPQGSCCRQRRVSRRQPKRRLRHDGLRLHSQR